MSTNKGIKSLSVGVAQFKIRELERSSNQSPLNVLFDLARNRKTMYDITIRRCRKREEFLDTSKVRRAVECLNGEDGIDTLEAETEDCVYDLINNNLLRYKIKLDGGGRRIDAEEFYDKAKEVYLDHISEVRQSLSPLSPP